MLLKSSDISKLLIWGHRGASADAPENTLAAFMLAEQQGVDGIELDIQLSRDGVPVILHDETLQRTSNGRGWVNQLCWDDLSALDAGSWFGEPFAGERIPRLAEVLEWAGERLRLNLEVKDAAAAAVLLQTLKGFPRARVLVSSFNHSLLAELRTLDSRLPLGFLNDSRFWRRALQRAVSASAYSFHPRAEFVSQVMLQACQQAGLAVFPWTVDSASVARRMIVLGATGVFSNRPGALRSELERRRSC